MTLVVDASVIVAGLVDDSEVGRWAEETIGVPGLAAPALMPFEAANILRRVSLNGEVSTDVAGLAHAEGLDVPLATLDLRLARAPGPRCRFLTPPASLT